MLSVEDIVKRLEMLPHPEGGFFREFYRSDETLAADSLPARFGGDRNMATSIYFLLPHGSVSKLHKIQADEVWYFHAGDPLEILTISDSGEEKVHHLGLDLANGFHPQAMVTRQTWFGSRPLEGNHGYSLVGCSVAPGFDFSDFELADDTLKSKLPQWNPQWDAFL